MKRHAAPIIAAVLLLALYVGSYLVLVIPPDPFAPGSHRMRMRAEQYRYRYFDVAAHVIYWPLEWIDERIRPTPNFWQS